MGLDENKAVTRRVYDEMNKNNVDALFELLSPDYRETRLSEEPLTRDTAVAMTRVLHSVVPGLHRTLVSQVAEGDMVVDRVTYTGTSIAEFRGIPAGTTLAFTAVLFYRLADGVITDTWWISDRLETYEQAGVTPPSSGAR